MKNSFHEKTVQQHDQYWNLNIRVFLACRDWFIEKGTKLAAEPSADNNHRCDWCCETSSINISGSLLRFICLL